MAEPSLEGYLLLLERYRGGDRAWAAETLARWPQHECLQTLFLEDRDGVAAVLLHTDAALLELGNLTSRPEMAQAWRFSRALRETVSYHLDVAEKLLRKRSAVWLGGSALERDWWLAIGAQLQSFRLMEPALHYLEAAAERYPEAAEAQLALGALHETFSLQCLQLYGEGTLTPSQIEATMARRAEKRYRKALELSPGLVEGRLRLGRVLSQRGKHEEAERLLLAVIEPGSDPRLNTLGHLFLGDLRERGGQLREAVHHYEKAVRQAPHSRPCLLALSHAVKQLGHEAAAREAAILATRPAASETEDLWAAYQFAGWSAPRALAQLRQRLKP